jgi:hypothetical protein
MLNMESRADCKGNSRDCKYKKKTYTHMSPVAVYMWKSETLTAGDIVCLELATVLECLDSAFGTVMGPQLVEGINHVRSRQLAEGARDEQSTMSGAHSSGTGAATSEV